MTEHKTTDSVGGTVVLSWNPTFNTGGEIGSVQHRTAPTNWSLTYDGRPLMVIDPEDRDEVVLLWTLAESWAQRVPYSDMARDGDLTPVTALQAALREYVDRKEGKPEQPRGLGAVVEDADGRKWVRHDNTPGTYPWISPGRGAEGWSNIAAIRVLSEGVQP